MCTTVVNAKKEYLLTLACHFQNKNQIISLAKTRMIAQRTINHANRKVSWSELTPSLLGDFSNLSMLNLLSTLSKPYPLLPFASFIHFHFSLNDLKCRSTCFAVAVIPNLSFKSLAHCRWCCAFHLKVGVACPFASRYTTQAYTWYNHHSMTCNYHESEQPQSWHLLFAHPFYK